MATPKGRPVAFWKALEDEFVALGDTLDGAYEDERDQELKRVAEELAQKKEKFWRGDDLNDDLDRQRLENEAVLPMLYRRIHDRTAADKKSARRTALCFSGGGIRSATFNLGVLQGLAKRGLLGSFDYLSTVSGGGYLGSWLSSWIHRHKGGLSGVASALRESVVTPAAASVSPVNPGSAPLRHLRRHSRYLSPILGLFSVDAWTLATIYVRNLLINWLVLLPLLLAVMLVPRSFVSVVALHSAPAADHVPGWLANVLLVVGGLLVVWVFGYALTHEPSAKSTIEAIRGEQKPRPGTNPGARGRRSFLLWCWTPLLTAAVCLSLYWAWEGRPDRFGTTHFVSLGLGLGLLGWLPIALCDRDVRRFRELPGILLAGAGTGLALWASTKLLVLLMPTDRGEADAGIYCAFFVSLAVPLLLISLSIGGTLYVGLVSRSGFSQDEDREWWARFGAWVFIASAVWAAGSALVLFGPALLLYLHDQTKIAVASMGGISGLATLILAGSSKTPATKAGRKQGGWPAWLMGLALALAAPLFIVFLVVCASLAAGWLLSFSQGGGWVSDASDHFLLLATTRPLLIFGWLAVLGTGVLAMAALVHMNKFSMHGMYRDRLIRAYLGASNDPRSPDPFTGFDTGDNIFMYQLQPEVLREDDLIDGGSFIDGLAKAARRRARGSGQDPIAEFLVERLPPEIKRRLGKAKNGRLPPPSRLQVLEEVNRTLLRDDFSGAEAFRAVKLPSSRAGDARVDLRRALRNRLLLEAAYPKAIKALSLRDPAFVRPLHVVNIALNLVGGSDPAWQERKAESFTVSPLHAGSGRLGYRSSREYGGVHGISLGTAMTISGAAVSPNMGYHSSPAVAFLMTLFNVRLGWWLGNPGLAGNRSYEHPAPRLSVKPVIDEAFGLTDNRHSYVYLSDGGHFENLGLYEMVRRRCHVIVLGDGGCDGEGTFEDLGNAIRKIRIDLGIPINFPGQLAIRSRKAPDSLSRKRCAVAEIDYRAVDGSLAQNGVLIYLKPTFYGSEPADVFNYAQANPAFPHEPTSDQFFSEAQFESYRALGSHIVEEILAGQAPAGSLGEFEERVREYLNGP